MVAIAAQQRFRHRRLCLVEVAWAVNPALLVLLVLLLVLLLLVARRRFRHHRLRRRP